MRISGQAGCYLFPWTAFHRRNPSAPLCERPALSARPMYECRVIRPKPPGMGLGEHLIGLHRLAYAVKM